MGKRVVVGVASALLAVALAGSAAFAGAPSPASDASGGGADRLAQTGPALTPPTVRLIDAGAEPRQVLRYQFTAGQTETLVMEMRMRMSMQAGAQNIPEMVLPAMRMAMNVNITEVNPDGSYRYEFAITSADVANPDEVDATTAAQLRTQLASLVGLSGWARVDARGFTGEGAINTTEAMDPAVQQLVQSLEQSMQQLSAPLPEEAVGTGASWEVTTQMAPSGFSLEQTATMTVADLTGDTMHLNIAVRQTAGSQPLAAPGMPAGAAATLDFLESTGTGTLAVDLHRIAPQSNLSMTTNMQSTVTMNGETQTVTMNMGLDLTINPGP